MMFKSINEEKKTFSRKVVEHIRDLIASGQLRPGDQLPPERELAELMSVSRPTIREAFKILSATGLVSVRHGHGVFVADQSARLDNLASFLFVQTDTIRELFEVRKMIETETAAWAAKRGTAEFLQQIDERTQEVYSRVIANGEWGGSAAEREAFLSQSDQEFHLMVAEAAGNEVVVRVMNNLIDLLRESRMQSMKIPGRVQQSLEEHRQIAAALVARKADLARKHMLDHLSSVEKDLIQELGGNK